uniref:B30.2/SPRY domain-containing protein n=1 Tax=Amphiprion ocellaris TaxID=80972 RepID=A0AAQ5XWT0_AMPOC
MYLLYIPLLHYIHSVSFCVLSPSVPGPRAGCWMLQMCGCTRAEFLRYSCGFTLDPDTAHQLLALSDGDRKVLVVNQHRSYPDRPDRFSFYYQVLSRESLTRRCYWEVKMRGMVDVAVAYKSVSRSGDESAFGTFDDSWSLECRENRFELVHDSIQTPISGPHSSRVGVYLDHSAGILSFYSISETMTLLHRVQTTFAEPLHAGLSLYSDGVTAEIIV